jgi:hypothetical protein
MTNDTRILQPRVYLFGSHPGEHLGIKAVKAFSHVSSFAQNGQPGKSRLHAFEDESFEEHIVCELRDTPLLIMIGNVKRVFATPRTTLELSFDHHAEIP